MSEGKVIRQLVMYELKNTPIWKYVLTLLVMLGVVFMGKILLEEAVLTGSRLSVLSDLLFLFALSIPISTIRYKPFALQDLKGGLYASSFFIMLKQTPLSEKVIRKSRFILTAIYTVVPNSLLFILFYLYSSKFHDLFSPAQALALCVSWVMISYIWGGIVAAAEPGGVYTGVTLILWSIVYIAISIGLLTAFNLLADNSFIIWSIHMAQTNPILLVLISIGTVLVSTIIWNNEYKRYERKVNYYL